MPDIHNYARSVVGGVLIGLSALLFVLLVYGSIPGAGGLAKGIPVRLNLRIFIAFLVGLIISLLVYHILCNY